MHKVIQLILNFLYNKNVPPSMKIHVHWMNLMKNQIKQKFHGLEILKERLQGKVFIFRPFHKKIMFKGLKCLVLDVGHMCRK
jgi:hypothetical protein